jgi:hypothetical protein
MFTLAADSLAANPMQPALQTIEHCTLSSLLSAGVSSRMLWNPCRTLQHRLACLKGFYYAMQLQWWIIWFQLGALCVAALVQCKEWYGARGIVMGLMCVLTALLMAQTDIVNTARLVSHVRSV